MSNTNPLVFLLAQLAEGQNSFELEADPDELGLSEYTFSAPLRCEIGIQRIRDRIDVHLDLETAVQALGIAAAYSRSRTAGSSER